MSGSDVRDRCVEVGRRGAVDISRWNIRDEWRPHNTDVINRLTWRRRRRLAVTWRRDVISVSGTVGSIWLIAAVVRGGIGHTASVAWISEVGCSVCGWAVSTQTCWLHGALHTSTTPATVQSHTLLSCMLGNSLLRYSVLGVWDRSLVTRPVLDRPRSWSWWRDSLVVSVLD